MLFQQKDHECKKFKLWAKFFCKNVTQSVFEFNEKKTPPGTVGHEILEVFKDFLVDHKNRETIK